MITLSIESSEPLTGSIDIESIARNTPRTYTLKGLFFRPLVSELGAGFARLRATLIAPPRADRYLPFHDYPQADYLRLSAAVAAQRLPGIGLREALRRLARDEIKTFGNTMIGKAVLALAADARSTLLRVPDAFSRVSKSGPVFAEELGPTTVRVEFQQYFGAREYTLGQLEGAVLHYGVAPHVTLHDYARDHVAFDVHELKPEITHQR